MSTRASDTLCVCVCVCVTVPGWIKFPSICCIEKPPLPKEKCSLAARRPINSYCVSSQWGSGSGRRQSRVRSTQDGGKHTSTTLSLPHQSPHIKRKKGKDQKKGSFTIFVFLSFYQKCQQKPSILNQIELVSESTFFTKSCHWELMCHHSLIFAYLFIRFMMMPRWLILDVVTAIKYQCPATLQHICSSFPPVSVFWLRVNVVFWFQI